VTVSAKGFISVSDKPGRGYELKPDLIEKLTVGKEVVRAGKASLQRFRGTRQNVP
jgi:hypothetical protein